MRKLFNISGELILAKHIYSAKPGDLRDKEGKIRPIFEGKRKSVMLNLDKYDDPKFSENRRNEIKKKFEDKRLLNSLFADIGREKQMEFTKKRQFYIDLIVNSQNEKV